MAKSNYVLHTLFSPDRLEKNRAQNLPTEGQDAASLEVDEAFKQLLISEEEEPRRWLQFDNR